MIEINLLPGAKKKKSGKGGGFTMPDFKAMAGLVKDPWLLAFIGSWVVAAAMFGLLYMPRRSHVADLEPKLEAAQREAQRMNRVLRTRSQYEARRQALESQIGVIRDIDRERYIWPHILQEITRALPAYTWLDDLTPRTVAADASVNGDSGAGAVQGFQITGKSADIQAVTRFVRNLEDSPFIQNVATISTGTVIEQDKEVYTFTVTAQYQHPDSSLLTMEPLSTTLVNGVRSGGGARRR